MLFFGSWWIELLVVAAGAFFLAWLVSFRKPKPVPVPVKRQPEPKFFKPTLEELDQR